MLQPHPDLKAVWEEGATQTGYLSLQCGGRGEAVPDLLLLKWQWVGRYRYSRP